MPQCIVESRDVGEEKLNIVTACCASLQKGLGWHWVGHFQWWFCGGGPGGTEAPPNLFYHTPWYYAWTIQNFINVLIFRVRPRACYVKGTMKRQKSIYSKFI